MAGISPDSVESHDSFCSAQGFGFDLLSDDGGTVGKQYGTWSAEGSPGRVSYVIGQDGYVIDWLMGNDSLRKAMVRGDDAETILSGWRRA